ncbi:MAG TPA: DNA-binding protein [Candidatus Kapabacteria bacterium]|nr:DNA-binding protein [Candidatus Kapabacteria bacterium]
MEKDLTNSGLDRQNILNNPYAIAEIQKAVSIKGIVFEGVYLFTKEQIASFYEVDIRTIERYLESNIDEISQNGYEVLRGNRLKELKLAITNSDVTDIDVGNKTPQLGVFNFKSLLNIGMLLTESKRAELLRKAILDIVIDVINQKTGGGTKYINQRDEDFIYALFHEENYRQQFTDALKDFVDMGNFKYPLYTNKIYVSIFKEKANEYKNILKLNKQDKIRETLYSEVLDLISSYEAGFADMLRQSSAEVGRKLNSWEVDKLFTKFENQAHWKPLIERARNKMASRDLAFRYALHHQLKEYVTPLQASEFERFLGEKSKELSERLEEAKDVFKRLKERE